MSIITTYRLLRQALIRNKPHIAYAGGWLGHQNLGDEVLFHAAAAIFKQAGLIPYPHGDSLAISVYKKFHGKFPIGLLAGGTFINRAARECTWAKECFSNCNASLVFGTGVADPDFYTGRLEWADSMHVWRPLLESCDFVGVRGPMSLQLLADQGFDNVQVVGDPILVFAADQKADQIGWTPNTIGLNLTLGEGEMWGVHDRICSKYAELASIAKQAGWKVQWFVVWKEDLAITKKVAKLSSTEECIHIIYNDYEEYFNLVSQLSVFVGMKLHATAMATCRYIPSVMLEYRPKCRDYMASIGQEDACIRSDKFDISDTWEMCKHWNENREKTSDALFESMKPIRLLQRRKAIEVLELLEKSNA